MRIFVDRLKLDSLKHTTMRQKLVMPIVLLVLIIFFTIQNQAFFSVNNFMNILASSVSTVIIGIGITFVMVAGSMDLSVGYQMSVIGVLIGKLMTEANLDPIISCLVGIFAGMILGLFNGLMVVKLHIFPMIVTLATMTIFQGLSYILSGSVTMYGFSRAFLFIGQGYIGRIPVSVIIMLLLLIISTFILKKTYFGRYVYAIGANADAAHLAGVNVNRYTIILYTLCGFFAALSTIVLISRSGAAASSIGPGTEMSCLTGAIIGGISFRGGEGSPFGMLLGIFMLQVLSNGMQLMGLGTYPQYIAQGLVLLIAIGLDSLQKSRKHKIVKKSK